MEKLTKEQFQKAKAYIFAHSDDINRAWFRYNFENEDTNAFMELDFSKSDNDYVHLPCDAIDSPNNIIYPAVKNLADDSLEYRIKQQQSDGRWPLGWPCGEGEGFHKLQILYEAFRTMSMLAKLHRFNRIEL